MSSQRDIIPYVMVSVIVILLLYSLLMFDVNTVKKIASEDCIIEDLGAIFFFVAGVTFGLLYFKDRKGNNFGIIKTKKNIFYLLLSLLFIFAAGEEVSWGQRLIGFGTPDSIKNYNLQGEFNIHNLPFFHAKDELGIPKSGLSKNLTAERLFAIFWLCYCIIFPLLFKILSSVKSLNRHVGIPVVPVSIGLLFLFSHLIQKAIEALFIPKGSELSWQMIEIKETSMAYLFMVVSMYFLILFIREK